MQLIVGKIQCFEVGQIAQYPGKLARQVIVGKVQGYDLFVRNCDAMPGRKIAIAQPICPVRPVCSIGRALYRATSTSRSAANDCSGPVLLFLQLKRRNTSIM